MSKRCNACRMDEKIVKMFVRRHYLPDLLVDGRVVHNKIKRVRIKWHFQQRPSEDRCHSLQDSTRAVKWAHSDYGVMLIICFEFPCDTSLQVEISHIRRVKYCCLLFIYIYTFLNSMLGSEALGCQIYH